MDEIVLIVKVIVLGFVGINFEDIFVLCCFEIEVWLCEELDILVFYDD